MKKDKQLNIILFSILFVLWSLGSVVIVLATNAYSASNSPPPMTFEMQKECKSAIIQAPKCPATKVNVTINLKVPKRKVEKHQDENFIVWAKESNHD